MALLLNEMINLGIARPISLDSTCIVRSVYIDDVCLLWHRECLRETGFGPKIWIAIKKKQRIILIVFKWQYYIISLGEKVALSGQNKRFICLYLLCNYFFPQYIWEFALFPQGLCMKYKVLCSQSRPCGSHLGYVQAC